ncbi:MAG: tRNA uridine(34) 5-carboxymethylaminomethyl modification radical SAM/GNAT enzyme Elp3 [Candidatus Portnoybacteria bacterium]|nr:tRNA uridine(34) 5-carboxymethylaminomethyl modification radical SAM/GNAT enzyme Elp3 [Candidatus Portnoybacteria bacterium]
MTIENYIINAILNQKNVSEKQLDVIKHRASFEYKSPIPTNINLLKSYHKLVSSNRLKPSSVLENILKTRKVRSLSGIAAITVITKPYPCPGKCLYCPQEKNMPKSYLANEPACMRAVLTKFDPYKQTKARLDSLEMTGHNTEKIELIVLGGTWSYYNKKYQEWFIKRCFQACNTKSKIQSPKSKQTLKRAQKINEKTKHRIIGLTLETRPDYIDKEEIKRLRWLGTTRIELGVQSTYKDVLEQNNRGHDLEKTIEATKLLKNAGIKVTYHMMPGLPGSSFKRDIKMFRELFSNSDFQPDQLKIYPCVVLKNAPLYKLWRNKKYKPYDEKQLLKLLTEIKKDIPPYVRIVRIIRDIPSQSIVAGSKTSNLRQLLEQRKVKCNCIRCREVKGSKFDVRSIKLIRREYDASNGKEIFLSFEDIKNNKLLAFLRLRLVHRSLGEGGTLPVLKNCAIIRELHVYGRVVEISGKNKNAQQHQSLGKQLMTEAEKIAKKEFGIHPVKSRKAGSPEAKFNRVKKIAVIAGIGVREYYKKLGYKLKDEYMIKNLKY